MLAYWKLLMRDRLMALAPSGRRREGQAAWKAVLGWAGITLLAVSLFAMAVLFEMVMYDQAKAMGEPQAVIALAFLACTLMTLIYSFFYVISLLFSAGTAPLWARCPFRRTACSWPSWPPCWPEKSA